MLLQFAALRRVLQRVDMFPRESWLWGIAALLWRPCSSWPGLEAVKLWVGICMYISLYIYIYRYTCCVYIYIYREREIERCIERERYIHRMSLLPDTQEGPGKKVSRVNYSWTVRERIVNGLWCLWLSCLFLFVNASWTLPMKGWSRLQTGVLANDR